MTKRNKQTKYDNRLHMLYAFDSWTSRARFGRRLDMVATINFHVRTQHTYHILHAYLYLCYRLRRAFICSSFVYVISLFVCACLYVCICCAHVYLCSRQNRTFYWFNGIECVCYVYIFMSRVVLFFVFAYIVSFNFYSFSAGYSLTDYIFVI